MSNIPNRPGNVLSADGVITPSGADSLFFVSKAGVAALTLALPVVDGQRVTVQDVGGHAHVITVPTVGSPPTQGVNGTHATLTFGGTVAQFVELVSYNGSWYVQASSGITVGG
jgi:hypothetical protein